ncbi:MAG: phosphotransferase [Azospirillaceae bacterium]
MGLLAGPGEARFVPLTGGVSSQILRVEPADGTAFCVKRALPTLKVAQHWEAPVERNLHEADYFEVVGRIEPTAVPRLLGRDRERAVFAMAWLDPARYRLWKTDLLAGKADKAVAKAVGDRLGRIHAVTAADPALPARFDTGPIFHALRLEPYLEATARRHADLAGRLHALVRRTAESRRVLVHGDVSPKNIMVGPHGPVLLDAECAWFGDPAFDLAFCLNHLLLKAVNRPDAASDFLACFEAMAAAYMPWIDWEPPMDVERRTAHLLPGLGLARIDGKSPVEYLTRTQDKDLVRSVTRALLAEPLQTLGAVAAAWRLELAP